MTKSRQDQVLDLIMEMIINEFIFSSLSQIEQEKYFEVMKLINNSKND
jgi:hypothetical protein